MDRAGFSNGEIGFLPFKTISSLGRELTLVYLAEIIIWNTIEGYSIQEERLPLFKPLERPTSYRLVCEYLKKYAQKDDLVLADPEYCNYPIMFCLGYEVRLCCLLTQKTLLGNDRVKRLAAPLMIDENFPDWYISFGLQPSTKKLLRYFPRPHSLDGQVLQHRYGLAKVLDVLWFDTSNLDFQVHTFGPVTNFDRRTDAVYVFKRFDAKPNPAKPELTIEY